MNRLPKKILTLLALIICFIGVKAEDGKGEKWTEMLTNGDAEMPWDDPNVSYDDMQNNYKICAWGKENGRNASSPFPCDIVELPEGGHAFIVRATDCTYSWDNQFWIQSPQEWKAGSKIKIHFRYKASQEAKATTQVHRQGPGDYLFWRGVGDVYFTTEWQEFDGTMIVDNDMEGMWSIAFNLSDQVKEAMDFYFDDLSWKYLEHEEGKEPIEINPNPTEIVVHGKERDDLEDDYAINENEGGTGHPWDNELWIVANRTLSAGEKTIVQFKYKSSIPAHTTTQCHAQPGKYLHYAAIGDIEFSEQWQNFETTFVVPAYADGMQSIDILMAHIKEACDYYIKDVVWKLADNTESLINEEGVDNFYVSEGADNEPHVYDPNGYSPPKTYTLSITSSGNGYVAYDGNTIRSKTSSFDVVEGTNAVLKFSADDGNRLKSVKVNGQDVTASVVGNQYTISNISANATITVVFEPIPTYSLNIAASGNGKVTYKGTVIRNQSQSFTLREGTSAIISFTPDTGYRIKSVAVNSTDVTSQVVNEQFTVSNIKKNTNVEVSFEEIPPTNYSLTIKATGNGAVTYDGQSIRGGSSTFTVVEGSYATVQIIADDGYRLKHVLLDSKNVTANVADGQYTTTKIMANMTLAVEFEAIPAYTLTIKSSAFGSVKYGDAVITNQTQTFTVTEGASAMLTFMPDGNGRLQYITLNGNDITGQLSNGQYTINNIKADQSVEAVYDVDITKVTNAGVAYTVTSYDEQTVVVAAGNYGQVLTVPATFEEKGKTWKVTGLAEDALSSANELAAIIWDPEVPFTAEVSNPNLLLYVKNAEYAPTTIQNVVVGNQAESIVLTEAVEGNNFYCPRAFTAKYISYEHNYIMITGYKSCQGWETIVLPFDVSMMISSKGKELVPHTGWQAGSNQRPFWLYQLTSSGWQAADGIRANVPYIISMPNNEIYQSSYNIAGNVQFIGNDVEVKSSDNMAANQYGNWRLMGNYQNRNANSSIYALNVNNLWSQNTDTEVEGSAFIRNLRTVHPFEAYLTLEGSRASQRVISIFDDNLATAIYNVSWVKVDGSDNDNWYTLDGRKLQGEPTQKGIYIYRGKKVKK